MPLFGKQDRELIEKIARRQDLFANELGIVATGVNVLTTRLDEMESTKIPIRKEEWRIIGTIAEPKEIDKLAAELRPFMLKYGVRGLIIDRL